MIGFLRRTQVAGVLFLFAAAFVQAAAIGDSGTRITGRVLDASGGLPVSGATVSLQHGNTVVTSTQTDSNGEFTFTGETPGVYIVVARATGYDSSESGDIYVVPNEVEATVPIVVSRAASGLRTIGSVRVVSNNSLQQTATIDQHIDAGIVTSQGYMRSGDALSTLPFVNGGTSSSLGDDLSLSIRGYDPTETATLLDGHPIGPIGAFGQGYDHQLSPFWGLSGLDVVYGSGATGLYGAPTVAGSIDFQTITPTRTPQTTFETGIGSFGKTLEGIQATGTVGKLGYALAYGAQGTQGELVTSSPQWNLLSNPSNCNPNDTNSLPSIKQSDIAACSYQVDGNYLLRNAVGKLTYQLTPSTSLLTTVYNATVYADSSGNGDTDFVPYPTFSFNNPSAPSADKETLPNGNTVTCNNSYVVLNDSPKGYECMSSGQYNTTFFGPAGGGVGRYHDARQQDYHARITQRLGPTSLVLDGYVDSYGFDNIKGPGTAHHFTDLYYTHGFLASDEFVSGRQDLAVGAFLEHQQHLSNDIGAGTVGPDLQLSFANYFLRDTYTPNAKTSVFMDLTMQRDQSDGTSYLNPRLSVLFRPTVNDVLRITGGRSSSVPDPSVIEGGIQFGAPSSYNPTCGSSLDSIASGNNPNLQPESAVDYEAAYGHRFGARAVVQADVYSSTELNPLISGTFPLSTLPSQDIPDLTGFLNKLHLQCPSANLGASHFGVTDLFNAGTARYKGYDLTATLPVGAGVTLDAGYAVQSAAYFGMSNDILSNNATLINGNQLDSVPLQRANFGIAYADDQNGWGWRLDNYYVGTPNGFNRPPYYYANFNIYKTVLKGTTLNLGVSNVFNSNAQQYGYIGSGVFKPENQFGSDQNAYQQGTEEFGLPLQQFWLTLTQKI